MIEWNDGLTLGIKAIDDEHKELLKIINELSQAHSNNETRETKESLFKVLTSTVIEHSRNEEKILEDNNFSDLDEHINAHNKFINQIPKIKTKYFKDDASAKEVVLSLVDWLFQHIIEDDYLAINSLDKSVLNEKEFANLTLLDKITKYITNTFSFSKRLLISSLVPLIGMLILIFIVIFDNYTKNEEMLKTATMTEILSDVNNLAHTMQVERGLSCGYLAASDEKFKNNLNKQRVLVTDAILVFKNKVKGIDNNKLILIKTYIDKFKSDITSLENFRKSIDLKEVSQEHVLDYYINIIKNILDITSKIATYNLDPEISSSILTLSSLLQYKEILGQERAIGVTTIEHHGTNRDEYFKFIQYLSSQKIYLNSFEQTATKEQQDTFNLIGHSAIVQTIDSYEKNIKNKKFQQLNSIQWFESITKLINENKLFENKLLNDIDALIQKRLTENKYNLLLLLIYTISIFLFTLLVIYIFEKSSKTEIFKFTKAMKYLAEGGRDLRLEQLEKEDEISQIYAAYEVARQKLLKGDVYMQLFLHKKEMEIQEQEKENEKLEEMASIDPLTSCVNRRKFEELSNLELSRSIRYKSDLSFLMLDIDHFKAVNDTYGHGVGDEVLKHFSGVCLDMARNLDVVARIGGEEFVVMLPQTNAEGAFIFAERFRKSIAQAEVVVEEHTIRYSVSIGISVFNDIKKDVKIILEEADKALYEAKDTGRDKTVIFSS
ncbi:MAG: diguanylate cyclase [Epsilonproteobacteria bacterium]|nr:MAG: diguanylate cyclase [Campylobacterota bacterium]